MFKHQHKLTLEVYTNVDFAGSLVDHRSTSGLCTFLAGNLIAWNSKKQELFLCREYWAMANVVCESRRPIDRVGLPNENYPNLCGS